MEITKPNDIFVTSTLAPSVNVYDLLKSDITPDNTSFFDKDTYKNTEFAKKAFKDDNGNFDELKFNDAYLKASNLYTELSNDKLLRKNLEWDAYDFMRPIDSKTKKESIAITKDINPYKDLYGRTALHSIDKGKFSLRELAQKSQIYDTKKGYFLDKTANDLGLLGSLFGETMVYAQWDEDGPHVDPFTNRTVQHKKGDYKLNKAGEFYIETLGDREIYGKQVVNPTDLITTDDSYFNKIDYFDSDGKNKSIAGTSFKIATELAPLFIPGVNMYYGTFKMALGLSSALPTFYKALEGIIGGDRTASNETDLWKAATKTEGFLAKYNTDSFSDEGLESAWKFEQLSQMITSTFSQIYEQRAAANLSKLFYKVNNPEYTKKLAQTAQEEIVKAGLSGKIASKEVANRVGKVAGEQLGELATKGLKQSGLAKSLSLGYMALTSTADIYHEALAGGYDRRTAGIAALLAAGGQYSIMMKNRMSSWFLDDAVGFNIETNKAGMRKVVTPFFSEIQKDVAAFEVNKEVGKKSLASTIANVKKAIKNIMVEPISSSELTERLYKNAIVEGVEEVTEQMVLDATKGIVDTMNWLGLTAKQGSFNTIQNVFSGKGLENYLLNFVGGILGGGLFELNRIKIDPLITGKALSPEIENSIIRLVANGHGEEVKQEFDRMASALGNNELSPIAKDENGEQIFITDKTITQADLIAQVGKQYVDYLESILNSENLKKDDTSVIKQAILNEIRINDLETTGIDKFILSDFNALTKDIINITAELKSLEEGSEKKSELMAKLNEKREKVKELLDGKWAYDYQALTLFALNRELHSPFIALNVIDYVRLKYNKDYKDLSAEDKVLMDNEFKNIMDSEDSKKEKMKVMFAAFKEYIAKYSNAIGDYADEKHMKTRDKYVNILTNANLLTAESVESLNPLMESAELPKYKLDDMLNYKLGEVLLANGYLDTKDLTQEEINEVVTSLNSLNIGLRDINSTFIANIVKSNKEAALQEIGGKIAKEAQDTGVDPAIITEKYLPEIEKIKKLTPNIRNSENTDLIPLDLIYLIEQLQGEEDLPEEAFEIINKKLTYYMDKAKLSVKDIYLNEEDILDRYSETPEFDPNLNISETIKTINSLKTKLIETNSPTEFNNLIKQLNSTINSLEDSYLKPELLGILYWVKELDNNIVKAESLLQKNTINSKFGDILKSLNIELFTGTGKNIENILNILNQELNVLTRLESPSDYVRSQDTMDDLKRAIDTLGLIKAIGTAMLDSSIEASNPYGFNVSIINSLTKNDRAGEAANYRVINSESYYILNKEISRLQNKFRYLIDLSELNQSTIVSNQEAIKNNNVNLLLNIITNDENKYSPINLSVNGIKLIEKDKLTSIMGSSKSQEEKLYDIEEEIYKNFIAIYNIKGIDALDELFEPFNNNSFKEEIKKYPNQGLSKNTKEFNILDYFNYLHSVISLNSKDFLYNYKNVLENELSLQSEKKAPFFGQEFSIKYVSSYINNKRILAHAQKFIEKLIKSGRTVLENVVFVTGSGGVGKTTVISNTVARLEDSKNTDIIVSAPSETILNKLKSDIDRGLSKEVEALTEDDLFKKLIGEDLYRELIEAIKILEENSVSAINKITITNSKGESVIQVDDFKERKIVLHPDFISKIVSNLSNDKNTIIFIDEISWSNPLKLKVLDAIAGQEGSKLFLVGLGDDLQNGYSLNKEYPFSLESYYFNRPPKLKGVIRAKNLHKKDNIETLEDLLNRQLSDIVLGTKLLTDISPQINYSETITLEGDKFVDKLTLEDLEKIDPQQEVVIITDDGTLSEEYKSLFSAANLTTYKVLGKNNIQGREFEQVIILSKIPFNEKSSISKYQATRNLYTLLSRGKKCTLIEGNGELIAALKIENKKKGNSPKVELITEQIENLLSKRKDFLSNLLTGYEPSKETLPTEEELRVEKEADLNSNSENILDQEPIENNDEILEAKPEHDGDNTFLMYSFYNVLNAYISKVDGNLTIKEREGNILSDLQILQYGINHIKYEHRKAEEIINEYIIAKNHLLHGAKIPIDNLFSEVLSNFSDPKTSQFVVRKITHNEFTEPYGKQAHMKDSSGKDRTNSYDSSNYFLGIKSFIYDLNGNKVESIVTLGGLPNVENDNWRQPKNKEYLKQIYSLLEDVEEVPITLNMEPLTGIRIIYENGTSIKPEKNNIVISGNTVEEFRKELRTKVPGLLTTDLNLISVFWDNEEMIAESFNKVGYDLKNPKPGIKNTKPLRFRPFIKVSYVNPNDDKVSKIMMLNTKKRSLLEAKREYELIKQEWKTTNKSDKTNMDRIVKEEFPALISRWDGILLFNEVLKFFNENKVKEMDLSDTVEGVTEQLRDKVDIIIDKIINVELDSAEKADQMEVFKTLDQMIEILKEADYDMQKISKTDQKFLLGKLPGQTRLSNLGLRLLDILSEDDINLFNPNKEIYYNPIWKSTHTDNGTMIMNGKFIKYFQLNCFLEPPIFKTTIEVAVPQEPTVIEEEATIEEEIISESILTATTFKTPFEGDSGNIILPINLTKWTDEDDLHMLVASLDSALKGIKDTIQTLKRNMLSSGLDINQMKVFEAEILEGIQKQLSIIISNPAAINPSKEINLALLEDTYIKLVREISDDLSDYAYDNNIDFKQLFLNNLNVKLISGDKINKQTNAEICK